jgi:hypothetical protein
MELDVASARPQGRVAIVGDECHIVAQSVSGPRGSGVDDRSDQYDNLILLCKTDHKRIDDQPSEYSAARLRELKGAHERWVSTRLVDLPTPPSARIVRALGESAPPFMLITSGKQLFDIFDGAHAYDLGHDELTDEATVELVAQFVQEVHDTADIITEIETGDRVRIPHRWTQNILELAQAGVLVYGVSDRCYLEMGDARSSWCVARIRVVRADRATAGAECANAELARRAGRAGHCAEALG